MLEKYSVSNFKIHQDGIEIVFPGLTILTGTNNSGKSSLIQSIRAYAKIGNKAELVPVLPLDKVEGLGSLRDVLSKTVGRSESIVYNLYFILASSVKAHVELRFSSSLQHGMTDMRQMDTAILIQIRFVLQGIEGDRVCAYTFRLQQDEYLIEQENSEHSEILGKFHLLGMRPLSAFSEIQNLAERDAVSECFQNLVDLNEQSIRYLGPYRSVLSYAPESGNDYLEVNGSNASEVIARWSDRTIFDGTLFAESFARWTSKLLHTEFDVKLEHNQYRLVALENGVEFGLNQIGFGNTQIIPVIVQILTAHKGDLVIIENPEVHLHPKWKADLIELFYHAAVHGVRIVIETQSMEMINRSRLMIKQNPEWSELTALYFFEKRGLECEINRIDIESTGQLSAWPEDFLDRVTIDDSYGLL